VVDIPDVVTYTNFGDHRLRGFWVAGGVKFPPLPLTFIVALTTLSCECVIKSTVVNLPTQELKNITEAVTSVGSMDHNLPIEQTHFFATSGRL